MELTEAIAVFDKSADRRPNAQTEAWKVIRAALTPQPSAAEGGGSPEYVLALLVSAGYVTQTKVDEARRIALGLADSPMTRPDAAVGAQGDGDAEFWAERLDMLAEVHGCGSATMKTCADLIRRLAAPAAGRGVDDAALGRAYRRWYGSAKGYKNVDADAAHDFITREAALTQQSVAGDGVVLVPRELTAENGAKAALIGDFSFRDGTGREHNVPWHTIKEIHRAMVAHFAVNVAPAEQAVPFDWIKTSERMPPAGEFVYTLIHKPKAKGGFAHSFGIWDRDNDSMPDAAQFRKEFAYWSPMPPLPTAPAATPADGGEGKS